MHPIEVGDIVSTMTKDKEIISAAVLHDTIEDCAGVSRELLAEEFSERVAGIVAQESEDKSKTWMERKSATIEHIRTAPKEVQMVGLADKLSNMRDIDRDYPVYGEELWNRFRMKDKGIIGWYYIGIRDALKESFEMCIRDSNDTACNCIHLDITWCEFFRQSFCESVDTRFGCGVCNFAGSTREPPH